MSSGLHYQPPSLLQGPGLPAPGPGSGIRTTCQFNSKVFHPPGSGKPHLWCSDALEHADFGADKLCFVADGCAVTLSEDGASYAVKSARNEKCLVDVTVARAAPGFQAGADGTSHFGSDPENPWGSMRHVFWPRCEVSGGFATADGRVEFQRGMFVHALQGMKPHHAGPSPSPGPFSPRGPNRRC